MKIKKLSGAFIVLAGLSAFTAGHAMAGAADIESQEGGVIKFEYDGDDYLRINQGDDPSGYMLVRKGEIYTVSTQNGQSMVMSMRDMMKMLGKNAPKMAVPDAAVGKLYSLAPTDQYETHAGIKGRVYTARYQDGSGKDQTTTLVLSDDNRVEALTEAMLEMAETMNELLGIQQDDDKELEQKLDDMNMGVLRWGDDMRVINISDRKIDRTRFELPAEPMNLSGMGGLGAMSGSSNAPASDNQPAKKPAGIMSGLKGIFGEKTDRQIDRQSEKTENRMDQETDQAIDNTVDKALNKIFGE